MEFSFLIVISPQLVKTEWGLVREGVYIYWVWKNNPHYFIRISSACAKRWLLSRIIWPCTDFDQYKSGYLRHLLLRFCLFRVRHTYRSSLLCLSCEGMESYYARRRRCCVTHHASFDCGTQGCDVKSDSGASSWHLRCSDIAHSPSENGLFSPFLACWAGEEEPSLNVVFTNCNRQILHSMQPKLVNFLENSASPMVTCAATMDQTAFLSITLKIDPSPSNVRPQAQNRKCTAFRKWRHRYL